MKFFKRHFFLFLIFQTTAFAGEFSEFGIVSVSSPTFSLDQDKSLNVLSKTTLGFGASISFTIWKNWILEPGISYIPRSFSLNSSTQGTETTYFYGNFQFPVILRYEISPYLSAGVGLFIVRSIQKIGVTTNGVSSVSNFPDLSWDGEDHGFIANIRTRIPLNRLLNGIVNLRYYKGIKNLNYSNTGTYKYSETQILVGISFNI